MEALRTVSIGYLQNSNKRSQPIVHLQLREAPYTIFHYGFAGETREECRDARSLAAFSIVNHTN